MNKYDSLYTGLHNDNYEPRIKTLEDLTLNTRLTSLENTTSSRLNTLEGLNLNGRIATIENLSNMIFNNITVSTSSWTADTTYSLYPYKANITTTGVNDTMFPNVIFDVNDAVSEYFAPVCKSAENTVIIYASDIPSNSITIPTILITKNGG